MVLTILHILFLFFGWTSNKKANTLSTAASYQWYVSRYAYDLCEDSLLLLFNGNREITEG